jgi:hypothetical protein
LFITIIVFETCGEVLDYYQINNYFLDHIYQLIELTLLSVIFWYVIDSPSFRQLNKTVTLTYWVVALFCSLYLEGFDYENKISFFLGSLIIIFYSFRYIYRLYSVPPGQENLLANPFFWIVTAHLFYYYGIFFYMGLKSFIKDESMRERLRVINMGLNYTLYILYLIGFLCKRIFRFTY